MVIFLVFNCLGLYFLLVLVKFLHRVWWTPMNVRRFMVKQGIKGPSYKFIHGNKKEISTMMQDSISQPMEISHHIFPRLEPHIYAWTKIYGRSFIHWNGPTAELLVTEPELIKEILNNNDLNYPKLESESYIRKIVGDSIFASEGKKWLKMRKIANHSFHAESLKNMVPAMVESADVMLKKWTSYEGKEMEVTKDFRLLASEVISRTAFGSNSLEGEEIFHMLRKLTIIAGRNAYTTRFLGLRFVKNEDDVESEKLEKKIYDHFIKILSKKEKAISEKIDKSETDFLGVLVNTKNDSNEKNRISIENIIDECKTFYGAGHGTIALLLTWMIFLLSIHTDWQEKARQEVREVLGDQLPNSESITKLKIANMIIHETLRLYPPGSGIVRKVKREAKLGQTRLPANMNVQIPVLALHHDPKLWGEDAHLFNPERFSEGISEATNKNPSIYLPFGLGPRVCVGFNFAINEAKITLAMILQRYKFTLSSNYIHSPILVMTVRPKNGIQIMLQKILI